MPDFDFMCVAAAVPVPNLSYGFIPSTVDDLPDGSTEFPKELFIGGYRYLKYYDAEKPNPDNLAWGFFRKKTTVTTYQNGAVLTSVMTCHPWYNNPAPDIESDLTKTGIPTSYETTVVESAVAGDTVNWYDPGDVGDMAAAISEWKPPEYSNGGATSTHYHNGTNPAIFPLSGPGPWLNRITTTVVTLSDFCTWEQLETQLQDLLDSVPLARGVAITTRDGQIRFDYFTTSPAIYPSIISGNYADDGTYSFTVPANTAMAIEVGDNDGGTSSYPLALTLDYAELEWHAGQLLMPYQWYVASPFQPSLYNPIKQASGPNGASFVSRTGAVTLHNGHSPYAPWQYDTLYAVGDCVSDDHSPTHSHRCTVAGYSSQDTIPGWAGSVGGTTSEAGTFSDGGQIRWVRIPVPVTAKVCAAHSNRFAVFPLAGGAVITADSFMLNFGEAYPSPALYPLLHLWNLDFIKFVNTPEGLLGMKSRVRIPIHPEAITTDVTSFTDIGHNYAAKFQELNLVLSSIYSLGNPHVIWQEPFQTLTTGEYIFDQKINTPTGFFWLFFGSPDEVDHVSSAATTGDAGDGSTIGGNTPGTL